MKTFTAALGAVVALGGFAAPKPAAALNPLGIYVGAAVGRSNVRGDASPLGSPGEFDRGDFAWKIGAGVRPIPVLGAEVEYMDFGHPNDLASSYGRASVRAHALAAFGVGYLPLPLPILDIYGKVGIAHLYRAIDATPACAPGCTTAAYAASSNESDLAYGAGVQAKFSSLALRAEYERISGSGGDPDLLTLGATWTF